MKRRPWVAALVVAAVFVGILLTGCDDTETSNLDVAGPSLYTIEISVTPNPLRVGDTGELSVIVYRNAVPFSGTTVNLTGSDVTFGASAIITNAYGRASTTVSATTTTGSAVTIEASVEGQPPTSYILTVSRPIITISLSVNPNPLIRGGTGIGTVEVLEDGFRPETITITVHMDAGTNYPESCIVNFDTPEDPLVGIRYENQPEGEVTFGIMISASEVDNFVTFAVSAGGVTEDYIVNVTD